MAQLHLRTPEIHRYHHSSKPEHYDTNLGGVLVYWDMIFGTFPYNPNEPATEFGLEDQVPASFWRQQIDPLIWIAKDLAKVIPLRSFQAWGSDNARPGAGNGESTSAGAP